MPAKPLTDEQLQQAIDEVSLRGTVTGAAGSLNMPRGTLEHRLREASRRGIRASVYATSTLIRGTEADDFALRWVKEKTAPETREQILQGVKDALSDTKPLPKITAPKRTDSDLLTVYPMGDPHFGQYSWADETGDDYDIGIAEKLHVDAMDRLASLAPASETALIINIGDYFHANDSKNRTPQSQHALDVDTRHAKVVRAGLRAQRRMIERALEKHSKVIVQNLPGNHDPEASIILPIALGMLYEKNPRVQIDDSPAKFMYYRHGSCLIGATHGDTCKLEKLGELMACDQREAWGATEFHHWFTGHWHHKRFFEAPGFTAEVLRTLAGKDAYAASHAYRSLRDMQAVVFDKRDGETERYRVGVKQLQRAA